MKIYHSLSRYLIVLVIPALAACHNFRKQPSSRVAAAPVVVLPDTIKIPADANHLLKKGLQQSQRVQQFYEHFNFRPFWLNGSNLPAEKADSLRNTIMASRRFGLLPQDYHSEEISLLSNDTTDTRSMTRLDIICTDAFLSLAKDMNAGRISNTFADSATVIGLGEMALHEGIDKTLKKQEPGYKGYHALKQALNNLLDTLNKGDYDLLMSGQTIDSLPAHQKVKLIEVNLERWRTETIQLSSTPYAFVNVPAYMFYVEANDQEVMQSKVIVGSSKHPTPMITSAIDCFTIFPYWFVPRNIAVNEFLPHIKKDSTFITRNNFDVLDRNGNIQSISSLEWQSYTTNNFPFTIRQREGSENSLGIVKFIFDNPHAVYLHDTNSKRLFKQTKRALSHGCIRLEKAQEFAHYLVGDKRTTISEAQLTKYFRQSNRRTMNIHPQIPIYLRYYTCEVRDGKLAFYEDIYRKDKKIMDGLYRSELF